MRIAVGLSGGVDSSVTALLLKQQGHEVVGINMKLLEDMDNSDAKKVADKLDIPYEEIDMTQEYRQKILRYIQEDYSSGRTPNPCVRCNRELKFGLFLDKAMKKIGAFDRFSTGHYAQIKQNESGRFVLYKGSFADKDQAYFLSLLKQEQLAKIIFPLGDKTKDQVRALAAEAGLFTADKGESQDLCVGEYRNYLDFTSGEGDFIDSQGKVLGRHRGIEHYTVGQRRGLDIAVGYPIYVLSIHKDKNQVVVGPNEELFRQEMLLSEISWGAVEKPELPWKGLVKVRYRDSGVEGILEEEIEPGIFRVTFSEARRAITPGQLGVFYTPQGGVAFAGIIGL
ncbi:MAG: tRNA 2-thiouridine(34) synthase MnmA [Spirochaetaceae bacterium]|jgi:tRNA-specific 2-thiouridylase|nr:tRNA 2-thiouridine(34) synthase MnmA [Spirochaetaceae bacterium]